MLNLVVAVCDCICVWVHILRPGLSLTHIVSEGPSLTICVWHSYLVYLYWTKEVDHHRIKWLQAYHPDVFGNEKLWKTGGEPLVEHLQFAYQGTRSVEDKSCITLKNRGHIPRSCLWTRAHSTHRPSAPASPRGVLSPHCSSPSTLMIASQKTVVENWCIK